MTDPIDTDNSDQSILMPIPVLPLRDLVVLPDNQVAQKVPLFVGRPLSLRALELTSERGGNLLLVAQRDPDQEQISQDNLYGVGTLTKLEEVLKLADGTVKAVVTAVARARVTGLRTDEGALQAEVEILAPAPMPEQVERQHMSVLSQQFREYTNKVNRKKTTPRELLLLADKAEGLGELADMLASHMNLELEEMQQLLELHELSERSERLMKLLEERIEMGELDRQLRSRIKQQIEKNQKEYYLSEQIKAAQKELEGGGEDDISHLRAKIDKARMPKSAKEKALSELRKLEMMSPMSAEASVIRNYLGWMLDLPWRKASKVESDLNRAVEILNEDHYGLEDVKERILEYLAVQARSSKPQSTILCLVGPPGVGKTSLGKSIARATGREFAHMALGGMRDEAEIRGHRRTYVGAMPGRIIQRMCKVGVRNPLFLLDELDKIGMDYRGDPAAALLEVLDPEQNLSFTDHFMETEYDLSNVMFVCTANTLNIPPALLDRLEVVQISSYTEEEKVHIATRHLIPKQMARTGLQPEELRIEDKAVQAIIHGYTREAGVRQLDRRLSRLARKIVLKNDRKQTSTATASKSKKVTATKGKATATKSRAAKKSKPFSTTVVKAGDVVDYLGVLEFHAQERNGIDRVGQITGLAWTAAGGEVLSIEASYVPGGRGRVIKTGSLGDVMQESVQAALTVVRNSTVGMEVVEGYPENCDIHLHMPSGATPKDGPSAGLGITIAIMSTVLDLPISSNVAVTGEITLRGEVLRIGALKEKLLAARRHGIKTVLIPEENKSDLEEVSSQVKDALEIVPVRWVQEVWSRVFGKAIGKGKLQALNASPARKMAEYSMHRPQPEAGRPH